MSEELDVLTTVTERLSTAGLPYMVTGSMALNFYAVPRMTRDIDLVIELSEGDIDPLVGLFQEDFFVERDMVAQAVRNRGMFNIIHHAFIMKVDMVVRKDSEYRRVEFARKRPISVEGHELFIVAPEDLILSKLEWSKDSHSHAQLTDVRNLLRSVQGLDQEYLVKWTKRLGMEALYREVTE